MKRHRNEVDQKLESKETESKSIYRELYEKHYDLAITIIGILLGLVLITGPNALKAGEINWAYVLPQLGLAIVTGVIINFVFQKLLNKGEQDYYKRLNDNTDNLISQKYGDISTQYNEFIQKSQLLLNAKDKSIEFIYESRLKGMDDIIKDMAESTHIQIMGVSLKKFFSKSHNDYYSQTVEIIDSVKKSENRKFQVMVINPYSQQALMRMECETGKKIYDIKENEGTTLRSEVLGIMRNLEERQKKVADIKEKDRFQARAYDGACSCFLLITDKHTYFEQYYFAENRAIAGSRFPLIKLKTDSPEAEELQKHFDFTWENKSHDLSELLEESYVGVAQEVESLRMINIFSSRDDQKANARFKYLLENEKSELKIMGISLKGFFQETKLFQEIQKRAYKNDSRNIKIKALFLDPYSEQAKLRSEREKQSSIVFHEGVLDVKSTSHYNDVKRITDSINSINNHIDIECKLYDGTCFFIFMTTECVLVELYHYGTEENESVKENVLIGQMPLFEYQRDSHIYKVLESHFNYLWTHSLKVDEWKEKHSKGA